MNARRLILAAVASLGVLAGVLALSAAPVLAATPETPETGKASLVTATTATLNGVLNPKAATPVAPGEYEFLYGISAAECLEEALAPSPAGIALGLEPEKVSVAASGLHPGETYTFCLVERNSAQQTAIGAPVTFTTPTAPPSIDSESTSAVNSTAATLEAQINANDQKTTYSFEYATNKALTGATTIPGAAPLGATYGDQTASVPTGAVLAPGTTYYYRVLASNGTPPTTDGTVKSFTTVPTPYTDPVTPGTATTATFNGHLTLGTIPTQYSFDYKPGTECTGGSSTPTTEAGTGTGNASQLVKVTGLQPGTRYSVCFVTSNAYGSETGPAVTFTTSAVAPTIAAESVTNVAATSATFQAQIDPEGAETTYRIEYGTSASYGTAIPVPEGHVGAGTSALTIEAHPQNLQPGTTYHYRVVASNGAGSADGADQTFTTQSAGAEFELPDGRQYELVSPANMHGSHVAGIIGQNGKAIGGSAATQAAEDGTGVTYITNGPVSTNPPGNFYSTQVISTRGVNGWSSQEITPQRPIVVPLSFNQGSEYRFFSVDLSHAVLQPPYEGAGPSLAPEEVKQETGNNEIYIRNDDTGAFQALIHEPLPPTGEGPDTEFLDATPDLSHVLLSSYAQLTASEHAGLYEWSDGQLQLVNVLHNGEVIGGAAPQNIGKHGMSNDGTRVVWNGNGDLFTRDTETEETIQLDAEQGGSASGGGEFQAASSDGLRVFFTDPNELTSGAREGGLFMFDVADEKLTYLAPGVGAAGVIDSNEGGTSLYFTSDAVLANNINGDHETATAGASNVYLERETPVGSGSWAATFIATTKTGAPDVSPNGQYLAFMSRQSPTGYDNRDAISGEPDEEVYLYSAEANRLVCASCNPTGARPVGEYDQGTFPGTPIDPTRAWRGYWLAATIQGWNPNLGKFEGVPLYHPRVLSNTGRLFFDSHDALVPQDVNGRDDVYEYEPDGTGSCSGSPGCLALISSGLGSDDSGFFDASANGNDVFFTTNDRLVAQDENTAVKLYDAHVCTVSEPCAPAPAIAPPPCTTTDGCRAAPAPQPAVFGAPASATFSGAGNVAATPTTVKSTSTPKSKTKTKTASQKRAAKLAKTLRACKKRFGRRRARRSTCEAQAKRKYGKAKTNGRRAK
jgi:hypothetical protein